MNVNIYIALTCIFYYFHGINITSSSYCDIENRKPFLFNSGNKITSILGKTAATLRILLKHLEIMVCISKILGLQYTLIVPTSTSTFTVIKGGLKCKLYCVTYSLD